MALEDTLTRIAVALEKLAGIESEKRGPGRPPKTKAEPEPASAVKEEAAPPVETEVEAPPAPTPTPVPAKPPKAPPVEAKQYTADDVRSALVAYQKRATPEAARQLLKDTAGVDTLRTLKPEQYGLVIAAAEKA